MSDPVVSAIVVSNVDNIEVPHEFRKVAERGFHQEVEVVRHEDVAMQFDGVDIEGLVQHEKEAASICVIPKDVFLFIAAARDVVNSIGILYAEGARHAGECCMEAVRMSRIKK